MIIETQYLPPVDTFVLARKHKGITIEAHENYQKKAYRNRCIILGANGPIRLSVPLIKGKNERMPIREVEIDQSENWQKQHIQSIRSAYGSSPFYEFYADSLFQLIEKKQNFLFDLNQSILEFLTKQIRLTPQVTNTYEKEYERTDFRSRIRPNHSIILNQKPYEQIFSYQLPFQPSLSIIDTLFCKGPEMIQYLDSQEIDHTNLP